MMKTDQTTVHGSEADFWINNAKTGVWRTARRQLVCCHMKPRHTIEPGERYLDTGEKFDGPWATLKICEKHANLSCSVLDSR
jgi:hypothetical protein